MTNDTKPARIFTNGVGIGTQDQGYYKEYIRADLVYALIDLLMDYSPNMGIVEREEGKMDILPKSITYKWEQAEKIAEAIAAIREGK
jgi:hypothetical protein